MNNELKKEIMSPEDVVMGPMNGPEDPHPASIRAICDLIGVPLPPNAVCKHQPSMYIQADFDGSLEQIETLLGDFLPKIERSELSQFLKSFDRKFKTQNCLQYNPVDLTIYFCDWLLHCRRKGFTHNCYFDYELYHKERKIRDTFLNEGFRNRIYRACRSRGHGKYLLDKAIFNETFKKFVKRDWIDTTHCTYEEFIAFCERHEKFFAKPVRGTGGAGARVIHRNEDTSENLFAMCQEETLILEEIVRQHASLAEFNAGSVNTTRVITLMCADGVPRVMFSVVRFGREGIVVDNFHGGGVGAIIDPDTGVIISNAINRVHDKVIVHPDTQKQFFGFQYPEWEKVKAAVLEAHMMLPEMRNIGWDVTVTEDGDVEFIEGNGKPNNHLPQAPDQTGRRHRYEPYLEEIEALNGKKAKPYKMFRLDYMQLVHEKTGTGYRETDRRMLRLREATGITAKEYYLRKFMLRSEVEEEQLLTRKHTLNCRLQDALSKMELESSPNPELQSDIAEFYELTELFMSASAKKELQALICHWKPELKENLEELSRIVVDMAVSRALWAFTDDEYFRYGLAYRSVQEKCGFISGKEVKNILHRINDAEKVELLEDKQGAYNLLKKYYGRKLDSVSGEEVEAIQLHEDLTAIDTDAFVTVTLMTSIADKKATIHRSFIRFEKGDEGIIAEVDPQLGIINSFGRDDWGKQKRVHPDTEIPFKGYRLPGWKKAAKLALKLAAQFPELGYCGWKLTYTNKRKWILVEPVARPMFEDLQTIRKIGLRKEFYQQTKAEFAAHAEE